MPSDPKHTTLPWAVKHHKHGDEVVQASQVDSDYARTICWPIGSIFTNDKGQADAALIVKSVNAHEGLVDALINLASPHDTVEDMAKIAREALALIVEIG